MSETATPAILLRRRPYGDANLVVTLLTADQGKRTFLARSARRSVRRFAGCLDPFSLLRIVTGRGKGGLDELREATLDRAFPGLRTDPYRMALASLWTEMVEGWLEPVVPQPPLFDLFRTALDHLEAERIPAERVHLIFQLRFLNLAGLAPDLFYCRGCGQPLEGGALFADIPAGGFRCARCGDSAGRESPLPSGLLPRLRRMARPKSEGPPSDASADAPAARLLEQFIAHHLGRTPRSLAFLRNLRKAGDGPGPPTERQLSHAGSSA